MKEFEKKDFTKTSMHIKKTNLYNDDILILI